MENIEIITTGDGSHSLLNRQLGETYHSHHGALQESLHVFIHHGLNYFSEKSHKHPFRVFEIGFGTGLNAWLTLLESEKKSQRIEYTSIESYPLEENIWRQLNYAKTEAEKSKFEKIHDAEWSKLVHLSANFSLLKLSDKLQQIILQAGYYDVIYFDAFAPNKQPEMWELSVLEKVVQSMSNGGVFVTYCAKGQVKRDLRSLGLLVETLAGPPGKKEMVRGTKVM